RVVLRLRDLAGQRRELAEIHHRHKELAAEIDTMRRLLDAVPMPTWMRDAGGRLVWANRAFAVAAGADDAQTAVARNADFLDANAREHLGRSQAQAAGKRLPATIAGERRTLDLFEARTPD